MFPARDKNISQPTKHHVATRLVNRMRQRRRPSPSLSETDSNPIDTDDQDALVNLLETESKEQLQTFRRLVVGVNLFAACLSLSYPLLCYEECALHNFSCWSHAGLSGLIHLITTSLVLKRERAGGPYTMICTVAIALTFVALGMGILEENLRHFHFGLNVGNSITLSGVMLFRWDVQSTERALKELHDSKYEHKTL